MNTAMSTMSFAAFYSILYCSHEAGQFSLSTVTVSAESVDGPTPVARVTWSTTAPPECVTSVRVDFRTSRFSPVVATYNSTNTSGTAVIQTDLRCGTYYYITVVVTGKPRGQITPQLCNTGS